MNLMPNAYRNFKKHLILIKDKPLFIALQLIPISVLLIQAVFNPGVLNPLFGADRRGTYEGVIIGYFAYFALIMINSALLISHNLYLRDESKDYKIQLSKIKKYFTRVIIGGLIISALYNASMLVMPLLSILIHALFIYYNQAIIWGDKSLLHSFKDSVIKLKNNFRKTIELLSLTYLTSMISWIPLGVIIICLIQPSLNLTIAETYSEIKKS